ncbi:hypothetical protein [Cellulomonas palmilytica]|uniref:hypothetical protein n=1 Tax=Cellulomonas palmilytica TaxID=2608402 RepID=UPI001F491DB5|nr:hypothetical protein [Cellulomonas palmilytica]UJP41146.1 hypothetical protein F1D97_06785 [Cellulomonas palmilytica]
MRFVLRNGVLPWTMLVVASVCAAVLAMRGAPWRADLLWIVDWIPIGHIALAPVIAGTAAVDVARLGVGTRHLEGARWWRSPGAAVALAYAVCVGGTYVAAILVAALVELPPAMDPRVLLAVAVQLLMLTLFAVIGVTIGRILPPVLGGVIAAVVALVGIYLVAVNAQLARLFDAARGAGYDSLVPAEVREVTGGDIEWYGASLLIDEPLSGAPVTPSTLVLDLVDPSYCDERGGEEPMSDAFSAESYNVESTWLELVDPALVAEREAYRTLEPDEVDRLMREFRTCTYPFR